MDSTSDNPERQMEDRAFSAPDLSAAEKRKTSDRPKSQMELELAREGGWVLKDKKEKEQIFVSDKLQIVQVYKQRSVGG